MAATRTIPIVMVHGAPLQLGAINSLARPGGNVTGLSAMDAEIGGKRVQLLRELIPNLSRIAVLATTPTTSSFGPPFVEDLRLAATSVGVGFEPILIGGPSEFRSAFAEMGKANVQAVVVQAFFDPYRGTLIDLASKYRLPYMSGNKEVTAAGGLVSMAANWSQLYERAAFYVDKILKGAKPGDLPVEQPTKFDVTLNMKTAQALGLTISPTLLAQIDEVIE
jgi:putative ABC transport system substrate-binding protein